ncbi:MAG: hypothetical protein ACRDWT_03025 [Jatrophihabitantaceae bacterium]
MAPARVLDTRVGIGAAKKPVSNGGTVAVQVEGQGGVPASGVSAVVLNVTVTNPTGTGYATVYADGQPKPTASNLNYVAGQTVPNLVVAPVGADGKVDISVYRSTDLFADVSGYILSTNIGAATVSTSRYVRNISGAASDVQSMNDEGCADATANGSTGDHLMLLDIGAQTITGLGKDHPGVALSASFLRCGSPIPNSSRPSTATPTATRGAGLDQPPPRSWWVPRMTAIGAVTRIATLQPREGRTGQLR